MSPQTLERVTEGESRRRFGIEERLDAEVIAGAPKTLGSSIPDREDEVAQQMVRTAIVPGEVCAENQLGIRGLSLGRQADRLERGDQTSPIIDAGIRDDPDPAIKAEWLLIERLLIGRLQQRA